MSKSEEMEGKCIAGCMKGFPKAHTNTHTHTHTHTIKEGEGMHMLLCLNATHKSFVPWMGFLCV